jgi:iron complex outermembrane receptor protein
MARIVSTALLLLSVLAAQAQTGTIRGRVRDNLGTPLPGVNVVVEGTLRGTATDAEGRYELDQLPVGRYTLVASAIGYRREARVVAVTDAPPQVVDFTLYEAVLEATEVVVTAARREQDARQVGVSMAVITPRELEARNVVALDDALRHVPGLQMQENQVNIRGSSGFAYNTGSRVLLLVDGVPLLTPDSDGIPFEAVPIEQIDRIEVLKGPGSALYGSGALGGIVQVLTKAFPDTPQTTVRLYGGAYAPARYQLWRDAWEHGDEYRRLGGLALSHARRLGGASGLWANLTFRDDTGYLNLAATRSLQGYVKFGTTLRKTLRLDILTGVLLREKDSFLFWNGGRDALNPGSIDLGTNSNAQDGADRTGSNDNRSNQFSLLPTLTHLVGPTLFYTVKGRLFGSLIRPIDNETGKPRPLADGTLGFRYGAEVQVNYRPHPAHYLTFGLTGDANTTESSFFVSSDGDRIGRQPEGAAFAQWEHQPHLRLHLTGGLRFDTYRIDANDTVRKLSPKLSATWALNPLLSVRAAFGQGFRVPSFAERFTDNQDFFPIVRNLSLRPEESTSYEVGLRGGVPWRDRHRLRLDAALFWNTFTGLIEPRFVAALQSFQFVNLTEARIRGAETSLEATLAGNRVQARLGYTWLDADDRTDASQVQPLVYRPQHLLLTALDGRLYGPLSLGFDYRFASLPERVDSDFSRFVRDADLLVATRVLDVRLSVQGQRHRVALLLKNALDYYYLERPAYLAPPRHLIVQLQTTF